MSVSRNQFHQEIIAITSAVEITNNSVGSGLQHGPGINVLRRGALITALVALETFIRGRTEELLSEMARWPASFTDLPDAFRRKATLDALVNINRYAKMLKREQGDFEGEIHREIKKMSSVTPPHFQFTKFLAGDFTGNISDDLVKDLLSTFQISDCWNSFHNLSTDVGIGVPSVKELVKSIVRDRHKSAHAAGYAPTATDVAELPKKMKCIGICFDVAMTASVNIALNDWRLWRNGNVNWRSGLEIFFIKQENLKFRIEKINSRRALKKTHSIPDAMTYISPANGKNTKLIIVVARDGTPSSWHIK